MNVVDAVKKRRSVRAFRDMDVKVGQIEKLVDVARFAPSAGNVQPWEFVVVRDRKLKDLLADAALGQNSIREAPVVIAVCADEDRSARRYGVRGRTLYCLQDTAAAIQNIHVVACSLGLGTCWIGAFDEEEVRKILKIPEGVRPVALIPVGYPKETPSERHLRPLTEIVHSETF